jgi:hypothetical protein
MRKLMQQWRGSAALRRRQLFRRRENSFKKLASGVYITATLFRGLAGGCRRRRGDDDSEAGPAGHASLAERKRPWSQCYDFLNIFAEKFLRKNWRF